MKIYFFYMKTDNPYDYNIDEEECVNVDGIYYYFYGFTENKYYKKLFLKTRRVDIFSCVTHHMSKKEFDKFVSENRQRYMSIYYFCGSCFTRTYSCPHLCTYGGACVISDEAEVIAQNYIDERLDEKDFDILLELESSMKPKYRNIVFSNKIGIGALMHYRMYPDDGDTRDSYLNVVYNEETVYEIMYSNTYNEGGIEDEMLALLSKT